MKKLSTILLMLLFCCCFLFTGCAANLDMPTGYQTVTSNGGFVVGAGNYVYFANAFQNYSNLSSKADNNGSKVDQYAMQRLELNESNGAGFNLKKDEDENLNQQKVVNKIAGYETSNMYVVGEYLYFTTPNVHKNKSNEYEFNLSTLFRMKLDGSGMKEVFTTKASEADFYLTGGDNAQLLIYDDSQLKTVDVAKGATTVKTLLDKDKNVTSVVFPNAEEEELSYVYFTASREEDDLISGNILKRFNLETKEVEEVQKVAGETVQILAYDNGMLFYTRTNGNYDGLYSFNGTTHKLHRYSTDVTSLMYVKCENQANNCFVFIYSNNIYVQLMTSDNDTQAVKLNSETSELKFVNNQYVYYTTSTGIYRVSVLDKAVQQVSDITDFNDDYLDFDGRYVYFFAQGDSTESGTDYIYRADCYQAAFDAISTECVAKILDKDLPED